MTMEKPQIAILTENTLEGLGLASIIERMGPFFETRVFSSFDELRASGQHFFHHFVSSYFLLKDAEALRSLGRVIVLAHGEENLPLQGLHTFNVCQPEKDMVRAVLSLAHAGHGNSAAHAQMAHAMAEDGTAQLTRRETDVLRLIVRGKLNKEIAYELGIGLTTVITHRKNLTAKLGIRSVSGLTIYAVTHGLVRIEDV